jgi:hypothetical protein
MDARMIDSGYFTVNPATYPDGFTITLEHQPKNSRLLTSEAGKQIFFGSPQIENPPMLGLIPLSQI